MKLIHVPTNMTLVCQGQTDCNYIGGDSMYPVQLRSKIDQNLELAQKWMVLPRYKYREEGNAVRVSDHVVLRSVQFGQLALSSFETPEGSTGEHLAALVNYEIAIKKSCLKLIKVLPSQNNYSGEHLLRQDFGKMKTTVFGNDFIRLTHLEFNGNLICRVDDEKEISSVVAPLGSVCRKQTGERDRTHAIFIRSTAIQQPKAKYDFFASLSAVGIWQIIVEGDGVDSTLQNVVRSGSTIRLRHLISGQYLSVRPIEHGDSAKIKECYYDIPCEMHTARSRKYSSKVAPEHEAQEDDHVSVVSHQASSNEDEQNSDTDPVSLANRVIKVKIISATVKNLKNVDWIGRSNPYLMISFGKILKVQSESVEQSSSREASWVFSDKSCADEFVFQGTLDALKNEMLRVSVLAKHNVFQDTLIGNGGISIGSQLKMDNYTRFETTIKLQDKKGKEAGTLSFDIIAERKSEGMGIIDSLIGSTSIKQNHSAISHSIKYDVKKNDSMVEEGIGMGESSNAKHKNNVPHRVSVATSAAPHASTLFRVILVDDPKSVGEIKFGDNIVLEHVLSKCKIAIGDNPSNYSDYSKWWEYRQDAPVKPSSASSKENFGSHVFRFGVVPDVEVQDAVYAVRMLPLARAATATLQLTPSSAKLYSPLFRHFKNALNTLTLWTLGLTDIDGLLLPESYFVDANAGEPILDSEFHLSGDNEDGMDSDDELEDEGIEHNEMPRVDKYHGSAPQAFTVDHSHIQMEKTIRHSSYSPWLGRSVESSNTDDSHITELDTYVEQVLHNLKDKEIPLDAIIMRRQIILLDTKMIEQLMHFLNAFFILQRSISNTLDESVLSEYANIPKLIERCCIATQMLLHACVYKNERNALKMLSVQGSFLSLISQKVKGWNPPIETIMKVAFESFMVNTTNGSPSEETKITELDEVLMRSITGNDIRQILEQMQEMYLNDHKSSENILNLLTLLCQSGRAKQYFQNILVKLLITCGDKSVTDFLPGGNFASGEPFDRSHSCLLFTTRFVEEEWKIQFRSPYSLPPQDARSVHAYARQLSREAECLKNLFASYNTVDDSEELLDIEECFCLLEDLGFGGPFIYEEIGYLMGSSMWGFLNWWCRRASFFYPSTSVSQSQISPMQAMKLMGRTVTKDDLDAELKRNRIDRETIVQSLRFQGIISSRIPGFNLVMKSSNSITVDDDSASYSASNRSHSINKMMRRGSTSRGIKAAISTEFSSSWMNVEQAFSSSTTDHSWFRSSLMLLQVLCLDKNVYCQRIVGTLLPAELLLQSLRNPSLSHENRHIMCDLLKSLYIEHDFVFPTRSIPLNPVKAFCGYKEEIENPNISVGKVFNPLSRVKFFGEGFEEGSKLRMYLHQFLTEEISAVRAFSAKRDEMLYANSLLQVFLHLLRVGFFGEPEFRFFIIDTESNGMAFQFPFQNSNNVDGEADDENVKPSISNFKMLQTLLLEKLDEAIKIHRFGEESLQDENRNNLSFGDMARSSLVITKTSTKGLGSNRKSFDGIVKDLCGFDEIFSDNLYNSIINTVMSILFELQDISQMLRVQSIWNECPRAINKYSVVAYGADVSSLHVICEEAYFRKIIDPLFKDATQDDFSYVSAVFTATLHSDPVLQKRCYDILDRRLNLPFRVAKLLDDITFCPTAHDAFLRRLIQNYANQICRYVSDVFFDEDSLRPHLLQLIDFTAENLFGLLFESFLDKVNSPPVHEEELQEVDDGVVNRFESDRHKVVWFYLTSVDIPCPIGEDDFFAMDLKSIKSNPDEMATYAERYSIDHQRPITIQLAKANNILNRHRNTKEWKVNGVETLANMALRLLEMFDVHQRTSRNLEFSSRGAVRWNEMTITMQFLYDKIFSLFAILGDKSAEFCEQIFPAAISLLLPFYPFSLGAIALVHTLLRQCNSRIIFDHAIAEVLLRKIDKIPSTASAGSVSTYQWDKSQISADFLLALLESHSSSLNMFGLHLMTNNYEDFFELSNVSFTGSSVSPDMMNTKLSIFLKPVHLCLANNSHLRKSIGKHTGRLSLPKASMSALKMLCNLEFCVSTLENPLVSLENKGMTYFVASRLYDLQYLSTTMFISGVMEDLVLREVRSLRTYFSISADNGKSLFTGENMQDNVFQRFVFDGLLPGMKHRILETNILSMSNVNGYIFAEIAQQDDKMVNKIVAKHVLSHLKKEFEEEMGFVGIENHENDSHLHPGNNFNAVQPLPSACINIVMILFNIIANKEGEIYRSLEHKHIILLIWIVGALELILLTRGDYLYDYAKDAPIDLQDYEVVRLRLHELLTGLLLDRIAIETQRHLEEFFTKEVKYFLQCQLQALGHPKSIRSKLMNRFLSSEVQDERKEFLQSIGIQSSFSDEFFLSTANFRFLTNCLASSQQFIELEGMLMFTDSFSPVIRTKAYCNKFSSYSTFDIWSKGNGRYLSNLLTYLSEVTSPSTTEYNLIHLICKLTNNKIESIRNNPFMSLNIKMAYVEAETVKLRSLQRALYLLGGMESVIKVLGRCYSIRNHDYTLFYAPLILRMGSELVSWQNIELQNSFVDIVLEKMAVQKPPELDCVNGLQFLIRKYSGDIIASPSNRAMKSTEADDAEWSGSSTGQHQQMQLRVLRAAVQLFSFLGGLCQGDNNKTQQFLSGIYRRNYEIAVATDTSSGSNGGESAGLNICLEAATLTNSILFRLIDTLTYIEYDQFYDKLGPFVNLQKDNSKRRFFAWHQHTFNITLIVEYIHTVSIAFDNCISLCCAQSVSGIVSALPKTPALLEFLGLMQLTAFHKVPASSVFSLSSARKVYWKGGDPFRYYSTYIREMNAIGLFKTDNEQNNILREIALWKQLAKKKRSGPNMFGGGMVENQSMGRTILKGNPTNSAAGVNPNATKKAGKLNHLHAYNKEFRNIFGLSYELFLEFVRKAEYSCLRVILSCLEFTNTEQNKIILSSFHDGILIQNMGNLFHKMNTVPSHVKDTVVATTVSYISLIEAIGLIYPETNSLLDAWDRDNNKKGLRPKDVYGCVEIVGQDRRLRRLYFPVPSYVATYWKYPEVQKTKDAIVVEVNRSSPEEKIADFLDQMNRISLVMKRQERLKFLLTYPVHALFGGKSFRVLEYMPGQRAFSLALTFGLNVYFVYYNTYPHEFYDLHGIFQYGKWTTRDYVVRFTQYGHLLLLASFALRTILNSESLDSVVVKYDGERPVVKILAMFANVPFVFGLVISDCAWPIVLVVLGFFAVVHNYWLYVPLLADVIFQFDAMYFLYLAIARNMSRVGFTLLLSFLCLYFYAICAYLFIGDQYSLNDKVNCQDAGSCFKLHLDYGLANAPSWNGDGFISPQFGWKFPYANVTEDLVGTFYNLTYVILINLVLQAIISGLIIDSFQSMREEKESVLEDIGDKCFICSIPRDSFDQVGINFKTHIKEEHNMWHYAWFKIYLDLKDPLSYSSTENYAYKCMKDNQVIYLVILNVDV